MGDPVNFPDAVARRDWPPPPAQAEQGTGPSLVPVGQLNGCSLRFRTYPIGSQS